MQQAFGEHAPNLVFYARQWVELATAEDCVQDVFVRLMLQRQWPRRLKPWLYKSVRNQALGALRSASRRKRVPRSVVFPGSKVQLMDQEQRHAGGRRIYYAVPDALQPLLTFDGSVQSVRTSDCNPGWQPNTPGSGLPTRIRYWPPIWQAAPSNGAAWEFLNGMYRWTREGLKGVDFGASEPG